MKKEDENIKKDNLIKEKEEKKEENMNQIHNNKDKSKKAMKNTKIGLKIKQKREKDDIQDNLDFNLLEVVIIVLITGIVVSVVSGLIVFNNYDKIVKNNTERTNDELSEFIENYNKIVDNYVDEVDKEELIQNAIKGMYNYLGDDYTMYIDEDESENLEDQLTGEYTGLGVEIATYVSEDNTNTNVITKVFKDSSAEKAGLKVGDILSKIDDIDLSQQTSSFIADKVKNGTAESFTITYIRDNKENTITIKRAHVYINSVNTKQYDNTLYMKIDTFSLTTKEQVENAIKGLNNKTNSLIIDLRDNTGGYLTSANDTAELFLDKGQTIYQLKNRNGIVSKYESKSNKIRTFKKIVVLVNESTASASEVLTLALKENLNAIVVGKKTFGKGTVQDKSTLSNGSIVKFTTSYWLSPNGNSINKVGIEPDYEVDGEDEQLNKAIEVAK
jgi:carboxyl-terminal processing protease